MIVDFNLHLKRQMAFSRGTFGPGDRHQGILEHISKELTEVDESGDPREWVDLVLLSIDGLWRSLAYDGDDRYVGTFSIGNSTKPILNHWENIADIAASLIEEKQTKNEQRDWPDHRLTDGNRAIEHDRSNED